MDDWDENDSHEERMEQIALAQLVAVRRCQGYLAVLAWAFVFFFAIGVASGVVAFVVTSR